MKQTRFARIPFSPKSIPFFYGWIVILMGTFGVLMSAPGQTIGLSTFTDSLIEALSIDRDQLSLAYMFGTVLSSLLLTRAGKLYDRYGVRPLAIVASICLAIGLFYLSKVDIISGNISRFLKLENSFYIPFGVVLIGFLIIRFFGQGVLTLVSRTMMMKWFDQKRGLAMGMSNVAMAWGFSYAPIVFEYLIQTYTWRMAWQYIAIALAFIFPILIFLFFRNDPTDSGLVADGKLSAKQKNKIIRFPVKRDLFLPEVRRSFSFWVFAGTVATTALYNTGFTFHVVSIFEQVGTPRSEAIRVFQWIALVSIFSTLILSAISDYIKMRYLLLLNGAAACLAIGGLITLGKNEAAYWCLVSGNGLLSALYAVIGAVVWARYFGKKQLGAIVGQVMMLTVFGSAIGPILFSQSLSLSGTYAWSAGICLILYLSLSVGGIWARNPQLEEK